MDRRPVDRAQAPPRVERQARPAGKRSARAQTRPSTLLDVMRLRLRLLLAERPHACVNIVVNPETAGSLLQSIELLLREGVRYIVVTPDKSEPWPEESLDALQQQGRALAQCYAGWSRFNGDRQPDPVPGWTRGMTTRTWR